MFDALNSYNSSHPASFPPAPMADPNRHAYPSPQMPAYAYPPPQQGSSEPYRSPQTLPPVQLPPIRLDGQQPLPQQGQPPMTSPLPPPPHGMPPGMPQYYAPHPSQSPAMFQPPRYAIPPHSDQRQLSGGRHKKEIKRRTKTGCLTCRKRRIKCDEAHPVCRNCQKSKRDCLGYDPIFKQQPGPAPLQPAPNTSTPHQPSIPTSTPPTTVPYGGQVPQGYAPAATVGYAPPPPPSGPSHLQHENFNNSAIDPALAADPTMHGQQSYNGVHALNPALRGSPYPSAADGQPVRGKPLRIDDIFSIANHNPPSVPQREGPVPADLEEEFRNIYTHDYVSGLDLMLESNWFSKQNNCLNRLYADKSLHEEAVYFTEVVKSRTGTTDTGGVFSQEARLIWHMLSSCKHATRNTSGVNGTEDELALKEVQARLDILEALLTNQNLDSNPLRQLSYPADLPDLKRVELEFWEQLGEFVVHVDTEPSSSGATEYILSRMRNVLNMREVRDAIYSIAITRYVGNRVRGFPNALPPPADQNPDNDINKLTVAMSFISHECRSGTQQVIARVCDMAMFSWTASRSP